ncbi:MAG: hypothetical protein M4D80_41240 [Myxococcota bacterium]|nr:hypothetical protein [Deltaproteobacteria bacterium]MDQ3341620.1 hypothetical protein [Myxococcota bacterium]
MYLKAMLVCDDVRVELGGTITLVGVHNERLSVPPGEGPIRIAKLMFVAIVGGLEGVESVAFRQRIRELSELNLGAGPLQQEPHDPRADEHNFVFGDAPMVFPGVGTYEVALDVEAAGRRATYTCTFKVERR